MNYVPQLFADSATMLFVASVLIQATLVIVLALVSGRLLRHRPLLRHSILLGGLVCVSLCPVATYVADRMDAPLISIAWPSGPVSDPHRTVPSATFREAAEVSLPEVSLPEEVPTTPAPLPPDVTPERPVMLPVSLEPDTVPRQPVPERITMASEPVAPDAAPTSSSVGEITQGPAWTDVANIAGLMWLAGISVIATRLLLAWRYLSRLRSNARALDEQSLPQLRKVIEEVLQAIGAPRLPPLLVSDELKGPISLGLFRPAIILPGKMIEALNASQLRDVLVHEMAHIHRHDHVVVLLQRLAGALFWPFPLVWRLNTKIDEAREDVCDNYVLRHTEASQYSRMLLELTERTAPQAIPLAIGLWKCRRKLEQRVTALLDPRRTTGTRLPRVTLCTLAVAFMSVVVLLAGSRIIPTTDVQAAESPQPTGEEAQQPANENAEKDDGAEARQVAASDQKALSVTESASPEHAAKLAKDDRIEPFKNSKGAFSNRPYWWVLPKDLPLKRFIRIAVGDKEELTRLRQKEEQTIQVENAGWLHIALANDGLDGPGKQASVFAKENGWEKTDIKIGYRVPLHASATPMFVYRKKVPVGQLTLPRVNWSGPVILLPGTDRVNAAKDKADPYDTLYDVIMTRWKDGKAYAHDETSPAIFSWSEFPFDDQTFDKFNAALDAFAALPQEKIEQYSDVQRALMQRNLWEVFETTFNWNWSADWWWDGQRSFPKSHIERRAIAQPKIASLIKRLALTKEQILTLPNPMAATMKSGKFAEAHDRADPFKPFLPRGLNSPTESSWICLGEDGEKIPADLHTGDRSTRSMFLQFMRLPGGRAETLAYMERISKRPHQFPVGTQFALLEQPLLISKDGELVVSPLVVAVQLRAYLDIGRDFRRYDDEPKATQCVAEFVIQPRQLMKGNAVMRAMGPDDFHFDAGSETPTPGFSPRDPFMTGKIAGDMPLKRLNQCMDCHSRAGGRGVMTRSFRGTHGFFTEGNPEDIGKATAAQKRGYDNWKTLQKYWRGEPVELPKPIAQTKPKTKPKPEPMPDRFPDTPKLRATLFSRIETEVTAELKTLHTAMLLAEVAKLSDMFNLEETESGKLRLAAREAANSAVAKARDSIRRSFTNNANYTLNKKVLVDGTKNDVDLTAFTFNGRYIILDAAADDQDSADRNPYDSLRFKLTRRVLHDWLSVGRKFGTFSNTVGPKDSDVQSEELWQKALSTVLTEEQITQYKEHTANRLKTTVIDLILTALQFDLDLDDSQLPVIRRRIEERVKIRASTYRDIESIVGPELQRLKAEALGDILSEEQLNAFPEHPKSRIKSTIISLVLTALKFDLHLADSHLPVVRKRLEERINPTGLSSSVESKAMRFRWSLKEKDFADVLTEPELTLWRFTQEQHN